MSATAAIVTTTLNPAAEDRVTAAAHSMYDAEVALHAAHQAHVDTWVAAAYDRLHEAIAEHTAALQARSTG